ncbi:MAG TPA: type II secretion system protein [Gemmatimonadaceae bacterium]|nr:type II secretion system protein [Gemmatimonadaceae bacterium]
MPIRSRRGIVLLEAIAALLVIGLTSAAALELFGAHLRAVRRATALVTAVALAQDRLTAIRLSDAERLTRLPDSLAYGRYAPPLDAYRWLATAERARDEALIQIAVTVTWDGGSYALATYESAPPTPERAP